MRPRLVAVFAVVLALAGACNRDDNPVVDVGTTTTEPAAAVTTTSAAASVTTVPSGPPKTPQAAAHGLFDSWKAADRPGASRFARQRAIDELFSHPNTGGVRYDDQGCQPQGGQFICSWTYPGGALHMTVEDVPGGGYVVDLVSYTAD